MTATKEMERKALEKIRKIVVDLGECSYIGMAFEGCFEIAEENIENDFGCSMQQRAEAAEERAKKAEEEVDYFREVANSMSEKLEEAEEEVRVLKQKTISAKDAALLEKLLRETKEEIEKVADEAAKQIVDHAEYPSSEEFQWAVLRHREAKKSTERYERLIEAIKKAS